MSQRYVSNVLELQLNMKLIPKAKGERCRGEEFCEEEEALEKINRHFHTVSQNLIQHGVLVVPTNKKLMNYNKNQ